VVTPATAQDNYALLGAAIECGDPVIYMEHKELWGLEEEVMEGDKVPLGKAKVLQSGSDVTLVTWSRAVQIANQSMEKATQKGISVELIDLRTIWPWDRDTVLASAAKTRRLVVAHEAVRVAGFGAEIAATVAEELGVPVRRLGGARIPAGYSKPLEDEARIDSEGILKALSNF
jgi:pyruvate dehydrogenase E1 component beta subunit